MIKVAIKHKPVVKFLKYRIEAIQEFKTRVPLVTSGRPNLGSSFYAVFVANNLRLVRRRGGVMLVPNESASVHGMSAVDLYKRLEYGSADSHPNPVSPALRRYTQRVIIPRMIKQMGDRLG
jgi:hypothetical protein